MKKSVFVILMIVSVVVLGAGSRAIVEKYGGGSFIKGNASIGGDKSDGDGWWTDSDYYDNGGGFFNTDYNKENYNPFSGGSDYDRGWGGYSGGNALSNKITMWLSDAKRKVNSWFDNSKKVGPKKNNDGKKKDNNNNDSFWPGYDDNWGGDDWWAGDDNWIFD